MLPFTLFTLLLIGCCPDVDGANEADAKVARFQICLTINLCYLDLTEERNPNTKIREFSLIQAQLASLMALSTQGGEVPLRLFAEHQAA